LLVKRNFDVIKMHDTTIKIRLSVRARRDLVPLTPGLIHGHRKYLLQKTSCILTLTHPDYSGQRNSWIHVTSRGTCKTEAAVRNTQKLFTCQHCFLNNNISVLSKQRVFYLPYNFGTCFIKLCQDEISSYSHTMTTV
jgi:hypothetical protein